MAKEIGGEVKKLRRLNAESVMERLDVRSRETLRQLVKRGAFPKPFMDAGGCCNYWLESEIDDYILSLEKGRK